MLLAIALPVMIGAAGLAVDVGMWYSDKRNLQTVADAAAVGGAMQIYLKQVNYQASATASAARNGFTTDVAHTLVVNNPPSSGAYTSDTNAVEVIATRPASLVFTRMFLASAPSVRSRAVATLQDESEFCVLGLDPSDPKTVEATGKGTVHLGCGIASNSSDSQSLLVSGKAVLGVTEVTVAGDVLVSGAGTLDNSSPPAHTHHLAIDDPLATLAEPTPGTPVINLSKPAKNATVTLDPGTYSSLDMTGWTANIVLNPGTYIIQGGDFRTDAGVSVSGDGVTIAFVPGAGGKVGQLGMNGGSSVNLSAPTSGTYQGVLFYQSRSAPIDTKTNANIVNGDNTWGMTGMLYFPKQALNFLGNSSSSNGCTHIVAYQILMTGDANFYNNCNSGDPKIVSRKVILVE